jgi:hypothetical protein
LGGFFVIFCCNSIHHPAPLVRFQVPQTQKYFAQVKSTPTHLKKSTDGTTMMVVYGVLALGGAIWAKGVAVFDRALVFQH